MCVYINIYVYTYICISVYISWVTHQKFTVMEASTGGIFTLPSFYLWVNPEFTCIHTDAGAVGWPGRAVVGCKIPRKENSPIFYFFAPPPLPVSPG